MTQITIPDVATEVTYSVTAISTGPFTVPFPFFIEGDIQAQVIDALGVVTDLVHATNFVFATLDVPIGQEGAGYTGGTITLLSEIGADGDTTLRIFRDTIIDRTSNYPNTGPFSMPLLNDEQNKHIAIMQEIATAISEVALPSDRVGNLYSFDSAGESEANIDADAVRAMLAGAIATGAMMSVDSFFGDAVETDFVMSVAPASINSVMATIDGVSQTPLTDFTLSASTITFLTAPPDLSSVVLRNLGNSSSIATVDSTSVTHTSSRSGAVARSVQLALMDFISVKDFGATGDGATDDTAAVNLGLASLTAGQTLYAPAGDYVITSELTEPAVAYWGMRGDGFATNFDISGIGAGNALMVRTQRGSLTHFQITGDSAAAPNYTVYGLKLGDGTACSNLVLEHVKIVHTAKGLVVDNCHDSKSFNAIEFFNNTIDISFEGTANSSLRFYNCQLIGSEQCLEFDTVAATNFVFNGCTFAAKPYSSLSQPINIDIAVFAILFTGNRFEHHDTNSPTDHWDGIYVSGDSGTLPVAGLNVIANYFTGEILNGIHLANFCRDAVLTGNVFLSEPDNADIKIASGSAIDTVAFGNQFNGTRTTKQIVYDLNVDSNLTRLLSKLPTTLDDTGTPTVYEKLVFRTGGTTAITDFDDGFTGQTIKIRAGHSITITHNASIIALNGDVDYVMVSGDTLELTMFTTNVWSETGRGGQ